MIYKLIYLAIMLALTHHLADFKNWHSPLYKCLKPSYNGFNLAEPLEPF